MTVHLRPRSVRVRLTLWYTAALACVLVAYAALVLAFLRHVLYRDLDRRLLGDLHIVQEEAQRLGDGRLAWRGGGHLHEAGQSRPTDARWIEVWSDTEQLLLASPNREPLGLGPPRPTAGPRTLPRDGHPVRVAVVAREVAGVPALVRAARSEEPLRRELRELALVQGIGLPAALALAAVIGYRMARRVLRPLGRMAEQARRISAERLGDRLPIEDADDELGQLAASFNGTFERLERSFDQLRRFTADASHELRTPLTALRSVGEVGLEERPHDRLFAEVVGSMLEEVDRLTRLVDTLLALSRADAGQVRLAEETVDLAALARDVVQHLADLADEKRQRLVLETAGPAEVLGDPTVLRQALVNVLDNAIKYSPGGAPITVRVECDRHGASIAVTDRGAGIAEGDRERIFERFYRVDPARSREHGGTGLGLSLARWGVESHQGRIEVASEVGRGSTFRIVLPVRPARGTGA